MIWFYDKSTIVGYLIPDPLYALISNIYYLFWLGFMTLTILGYLIPNPVYILYIIKYMICKHFGDNIFLNEPVFIFWPTVKWLQVLLYNSHNFHHFFCLHTVCWLFHF